MYRSSVSMYSAKRLCVKGQTHIYMHAYLPHKILWGYLSTHVRCARHLQGGDQDHKTLLLVGDVAGVAGKVELSGVAVSLFSCLHVRL